MCHKRHIRTGETGFVSAGSRRQVDAGWACCGVLFGASHQPDCKAREPYHLKGASLAAINMRNGANTTPIGQGVVLCQVELLMQYGKRLIEFNGDRSADG
jgi:hypothetical protein